MGIDCKWNWHNTGHQVWYDDQTFETLENTYPLQYHDDFLGVAGGQVFDGTYAWNILEVSAGGAPTEAIVANSVNGQFLLHSTTAAEDQDVVLYQPASKTFDVGNGLIFEARINMAVAPGVGVRAVAGMSGPHNLDKDLTANAAWFSWAASMSTAVETDDTTNDTAATAVATAVAGTYNIYRIDFTTLANVKFFIDGVRVAASTTFDMSNLNAAEQQMQPYFSLDKTGAGVAGGGDINIDYVKILSNRS
jgi:hypothetical protein